MSARWQRPVWLREEFRNLEDALDGLGSQSRRAAEAFIPQVVHFLRETTADVESRRAAMISSRRFFADKLRWEEEEELKAATLKRLQRKEEGYD